MVQCHNNQFIGQLRCSECLLVSMANNLHAYKDSFLISDYVVNMWVVVGSMTVTLVCSPNSSLAPCTAYCVGGSTHSYHMWGDGKLSVGNQFI